MLCDCYKSLTELQQESQRTLLDISMSKLSSHLNILGYEVGITSYECTTHVKLLFIKMKLKEILQRDLATLQQVKGEKLQCSTAACCCLRHDWVEKVHEQCISKFLILLALVLADFEEMVTFLQPMTSLFEKIQRSLWLLTSCDYSKSILWPPLISWADFEALAAAWHCPQGLR